MKYIEMIISLLSLLTTLILGIGNLRIAYRREQREIRKEEAERLKQQESTEKEKSAYPPRKDKHSKR
ncbi:hypothetical protein M3664_04355 [Paenibacillus lautus]|uniref:hypothetical protein n=1 Tax=Paenibacillus lautus TaxID=1401 RepID=UPI0020402FE1|nr:hypothetical protein [Paenibacillus lautus]MCM3257012.1 hypothetical protein [Paenibacillus lautus]